VISRRTCKSVSYSSAAVRKAKRASRCGARAKRDVNEEAVGAGGHEGAGGSQNAGIFKVVPVHLVHIDGALPDLLCEQSSVVLHGGGVIPDVVGHIEARKRSAGYPTGAGCESRPDAATGHGDIRHPLHQRATSH
ncbi:hypothetical protein R6G99_10350, partial [Actinotignum timonense]|nr:hypothetical protein [Actinotignum timonense]